MITGHPISGAAYFWKGFSLIVKPGLKRYVALPLMINILVFTGVIALCFHLFEDFVNWLVNAVPTWLHFLAWPLWIIFGIGILLVVTQTFAVLATLIAAPFNGLLAERVELYLTGVVNDHESTIMDTVKSIPHAFRKELQKVLYFLLRAIPLLLLFLIPIMNLAAPFLWVAFGAWMMSVEYMDYPLDNNGGTFRHLKQFLAENLLSCLSFGGVTMFCFTVPILNLFVMPAAVAGATAFSVDHRRDLLSRVN